MKIQEMIEINGKFYPHERDMTPEEEEEYRKKSTITNEQQISQLKTWFDNDYRLYNEKLLRFQTLGIQESVVDNFRNKTYLSLTELYTEAEVVRQEIHNLEE